MGTAAYTQALFDGLPLEEAQKQTLRQYMAERNLVAFGKYLSGLSLDSEARKALEAIPVLFGPYAETLSKARGYCINSGMRNALTRLEKVYDYILYAGYADKVQLDFGFTSTLGYYTDMVFKVYVDGALRFVTTEGDHLRTLLAAVRRPYMDPADADSRVVFAHELTLADGIYLTGSVSPYTEVISALQANDGELLRVQIRRRERYEQELAYDTQIMEDDTLDFGKSETVQTGVPGRETVTYEVVYENGAEVDSRVLDVARTAEPVPEVIRRGTRLQSGMIGKLGTGSFIWPVPAYRHISRWANFTPGINYHQGVDIAAPYGTEIYAADAGTVVECTRHWSWGNYVKIDHGNGYQTLYAHMSAQAVHVGDVVEQGQVIGYVGNTGNSFGNHCHFEMYYNERLFSARDVFPDMPEWNR